MLYSMQKESGCYGKHMHLWSILNLYTCPNLAKKYILGKYRMFDDSLWGLNKRDISQSIEPTCLLA